MFLTAAQRASENADIRASLLEIQIWYICGEAQEPQFWISTPGGAEAKLLYTLVKQLTNNYLMIQHTNSTLESGLWYGEPTNSVSPDMEGIYNPP